AATLRLGDGRTAKWHVVCGGLRLEGLVAATLLDLLPHVVVLRRNDASPVVASALEAMKEESLVARPGGATLMTRLADVIVIHAIRGWIEKSGVASGWLTALRDPQIGRAMAEVHLNPERAWSVEDLARRARLSRSRFSERFAELVGFAPMQYVTKLQMHRA